MICVSVANIEFKELKKIISEFEMIELRLDLLTFSEKEYQYIYNLNIPIIATYRYGKTDDNIRIKHLKDAVVKGAEYIDIEIDASRSFVDAMLEFANRNRCKTILSYHNLEQTPSLGELNSKISDFHKLSADYLKIATQANNLEDVSRILSLYEKNRNIIAFNMGEIGKISRLASLLLGADFTYASLSNHKATAGGQLTYKELKRLLEIIK